MSFDYNKTKHAHNSDSFWTSYSDLFLGLSTIFLLLYVVASLRTGTDAIRSQIDNQKLTMQVDELKNQLKMYESVKQEYMEKKASTDELAEYQELMDKLTLLQEDAKEERERLASESVENGKKAQALNKYQQMVRNIINANKLAKTKLDDRNEFIGEQDTKIKTQKSRIAQQRGELAQQNSQIAEQQEKIQQAKLDLQAHKQQLLRAYKQNQISKKAFEQKNRALQVAADQKIQKLEEQSNQYAKAFAQKSAETEGLKSNIEGLKGAVQRGEARIALASQKISGLQGKLKDTEGQLVKAREEIDARRAVAREIQRGFARAGIKADIDMQTGEVVLDFGDHYFEVDSADLKNEMRTIIDRAMPVYSKALFGNPKVADKISSVEIIGFASPTYRGRFVDPNSSRAEDRQALKYNMDLSYRRANSIFNYLLQDSDDPQFAYGKDLLAHMKVSGRSFLEVMKVQNRGPASAVEFCKQNDCKKAQRVIVRFGMDGKK